MTIVDEHIEIECSPASHVIAVGYGSKSEIAAGFDLTRARFPLGKFAGSWFRVMIVSEDRRIAWSNPIHL